MKMLWLGGGSPPFFLHIRCKLQEGQEVEKECASLGIGVAVVAVAVAVVIGSLILHINVGDDVGFDKDIGAGKERQVLAVDDGDVLFLVMKCIGLLLLLLLLLHTLNLEPHFEADDDGDDDDSFEDPDSGPFAFPLPAFDGAPHFSLVVSRFFVLPLLSTSLLLLGQLPQYRNLILLLPLPKAPAIQFPQFHYPKPPAKPPKLKINVKQEKQNT